MNIDSIAREIVGRVSGVAADSRSVRPGFVFVCLSEAAKKFIPDALKAGAKFVVVDSTEGVECVDNSQTIACPNRHDLYYKIATALYENKQPKFVAAVTGTNGKTSVVDFCRQIWNLTGYRCASIGTLGTIVGNTTLPGNTALTTPDAVELHRTLNELHSLQVEHLCIEASSHGIEQKRLHGMETSAAAFTNLSRDHLDYHGSMEMYWATKKKLFSEVLSRKGCAVLNTDSEQYTELRELAGDRNIVTYGTKDGDVKLTRLEGTKLGHNITIEILGKVAYEGVFPVFGKFQVSNLLCALAVIVASGSNCGNTPIEKLVAPRGRMELIGNRIIIDYAHTPDALKHAITSLRWHGFSQKIALVFGCGGNRDREKRKAMAAVANRYADTIIITDDNPRNENPAAIRQEILSHCRHAVEIPNRKNAIHHAVDLAVHHNHVLLIAGKGHETVQQIAGESIEFNDEAVARSFLDKMQYAQ
ncbi:UDP-N-acetylmuramoyl-L-alanyl-D-glutamate--2,6-diaminopimelate ligase [Anaplasma capra]|uniref:UDP-N-acetylmuramoyl-L-alanyl-D-glutamate--2, 6-diaminopimelate ligase n=1 Tax=Anaplasma capra TaxID=1562740 RepID=UPI0021D606FC|nr:UDP-N-acetylmuramoyl-L-alanyl-D-glutamate--2,6-diaminopimelate ligase [Anaplasma capra]MCU7612421.1 UDP-N-acetylmuramoyl-L-alanyl-D-glutamate--2,6-diaminopimelate ligase [Anaplasma capra]